MAKRLDEFPGGHGIQHYPWDEWGDGSVWEIVHGVDYMVTSYNMRQSIYSTAARRGKTARVKSSKDKIVFQFLDRAVS